MKKFLHSFILIIFTCCLSCVQAPQEALQEPRVIAFMEEADITTAVLSATFDHVGNVTAAGFDVWRDGEEKLRCETPMEGTSITFRCTGLKPETTYQAEVFWSNGQEERTSECHSFTTLRQPYDPVLWSRILASFDRDGDGDLSNEEAAAAVEFEIPDVPLGSLDGLERLVNLESLSLGNNGLKVIDVTALKKLRTLSAGRDLAWEEIRLDNPELLLLYFLGEVKLRTLDLSRCPMLYIINWYGVPVESVDFSRNLDLYTVRFSGSKLKELDLSANFRLRHLVSTDNAELKVIWLTKGITLETCEVEPHTEIRYK